MIPPIQSPLTPHPGNDRQSLGPNHAPFRVGPQQAEPPADNKARSPVHAPALETAHGATDRCCEQESLSAETKERSGQRNAADARHEIPEGIPAKPRALSSGDHPNWPSHLNLSTAPALPKLEPALPGADVWLS